MQRLKLFRRRLIILTLIVGVMLVPAISIAATAEELRARIEEQNAKIRAIEREIAQYEEQLTAIAGERDTLQNAIKTLDVGRARLSADIRLTEQKISARDLEINELSTAIDAAGAQIGAQRASLGALLRNVDQIENLSLLEMILARESLTDVWGDLDAAAQVQNAVHTQLNELAAIKADREEKRREEETKKKELVQLRSQLAGQKSALDQARSEQSKLLTATKSKEANYQQLLKEKRMQQQEFERALLSIEAELKLVIDPSSLPPVGKGVLAWPTDTVRITQYFGNTPFATANPQIYGGKGHNGIDLAASVGARIKAALGGVVVDVGNTDLVCPGASYGKWVLIRHPNGLSTLYAHLSVIAVTKGQSMGTGEVVGFAGTTGYVTGPHLHFTVYATQGVEVRSFPSAACKGNYTIPVADFRAYLNPLSYL